MDDLQVREYILGGYTNLLYIFSNIHSVFLIGSNNQVMCYIKADKMNKTVLPFITPEVISQRNGADHPEICMLFKRSQA
jgi:hypothetical protein